jgi:hypothetical protein
VDTRRATRFSRGSRAATSRGPQGSSPRLLAAPLGPTPRHSALPSSTGGVPRTTDAPSCASLSGTGAAGGGTARARTSRTPEGLVKSEEQIGKGGIACPIQELQVDSEDRGVVLWYMYCVGYLCHGSYRICSTDTVAENTFERDAFRQAVVITFINEMPRPLLQVHEGRGAAL